MLTDAPLAPSSAQECVRDAASRAVIAGQIERAIGDQRTARTLANAVVNLCRDLRHTADYRLELSMDDSWNDDEWKRYCDDLSAALESHVQNIATAAYAAIYSAFKLGLRAGIRSCRDT